MPRAALAALLLIASPAATLAAPGETPRPLPSLVSIWSDDGVLRAATEEDEGGTAWNVAYDARANSWSEPVAFMRLPGAPDPPPRTPRLDQVLVFNGGLFDPFPGQDRIDLGGGFTLAKSDSGYALLENGENRGWPAVTENEVGTWGREVRLGLPADFPEDRLYQLLATGALRNVPGPFARTDDALWFGLAGGFTGSEGQLGGLVAYDIAQRTFRVVRHKFLVDAAVTRLLAVGDELWIGTGRFGSRRLEGLRGMLVHRPKRREWRQFSTENSRISGDLVYDAIPVGRLLWVTTDTGVSRYDLDRSLWTSWYWHVLPPAVRESTDEVADSLRGLGYVLKRDRPIDLADQLIK